MSGASGANLVTLSLDDARERVHVRVPMLFEQGRFLAFKEALMGVADFDRDLRRNVASIERLATLTCRLRDAGFDVDLSPEARETLQKFSAAQMFDLQRVRERIASIDEEFKKRTGGGLYGFQKLGSEWIALRRAGLIADQMGLGKAQPVSEPVLTPAGWRPLGDLCVGDQVIGSDGRPVQVTGVFPQGEREVYAVELDDGRVTHCDLDHLWLLKREGSPKKRVMSLREALATERDGHLRWMVPVLYDYHAKQRGERPSFIEFTPIVKVYKSRLAKCVCIRVAAQDSLYVTRDYIVTHNTVQMIAAIPLNAPVIVVAPASIKGVWVEQINRWRPYLRTLVLRGRKSFRWPRRGEILITNYEILPELHDVDGVKGRRCEGFLDPADCPGCAVKPGWGSGRIQAVKVKGQHLPTCSGKLPPAPCPGCAPILDEVPEGTVVVVDEAHLIKNAKSKRAKRLAQLIQAALNKNGKSWGATGTPLENHPRDLWNVLQVLGLAKESFGTFSNYVSLFRATPKFNGDMVVGYDWPALTPEDSEKIRPHLQRAMLRRLRDEVLDLPDKMYQDVEVELDRKTYVQCEGLVKQVGGLERMIDVIEKSRGESLGIQGLSELRQKLAVAKIPAMRELVESYEEQEEPLIVFSVHRAPIEELKGRPGWGIIMGGESKDAAKIAEDFQNGKLIGIGMTISGGMGLTLTRAAHMLRVDHDWRPTMDEQVEDRLMRIGQTCKVLIKTLVANHPLEKRIMDLHAKKRGFVSASVDAAAARVVDQGPSLVDDEVKAIQEAASQGRAIRRVSKDNSERLVVEQLLSLTFDRRSDERLAAQLGEEAQTIGLSEAQWALAAKVVMRGKTARQPDEEGAA